MDAPAAISATFADFKIIKGRKQAQFIFELPLEKADEALKALGGVPSSIDERWCGIARLDLKAVQQPSLPQQTGKEPRPFHSLPYAQQAALKCNDEAFRNFLRVETKEEAAERIRQECGVTSRSEIEGDENAKMIWTNILRDFQKYQEGYR